MFRHVLTELGVSLEHRPAVQFPHLLNGSVLFLTHGDGWGLGKGGLLTKLRALKAAAEPTCSKGTETASAIFCCPLLNSWAFSAGLVSV